jgi:hypothetical protein
MNTAKEFSANHKIHTRLYTDLRLSMFDVFNFNCSPTSKELLKSISDNLRPINFISNQIYSNLNIEKYE